MYLDQTVDIAAPVERVWDVTIDIPQWPTWNPTVDGVDVLTPRPMGVGWSARLKQPGNAPGTWTVTRFEGPNIYQWETNPLGMHVVALHRLEATSTGTHVTLSIDVSGLTAPLLGGIVARVSRKFLPMEAAALKAECERSD